MKLTQALGAIAVGQSHVFIPAAPGSYATPKPRLLLCFHGAGSTAAGETHLGKGNYMLRAQAFSRAGLSQLWIDGGGPAVRLTAASAVSATSLALDGQVPNGVYILDPGNGGTTETVTVSGGPSATPTITAATKAHASGAYLVSASASGWGSDADLAMSDAAWTYAKANLNVQTDKVLSYANSAGNAWALMWALRNPGTVLAHAASLPVVDLKDIRDNNRQSLASGVESAASGNGTTGTAPSDAWYAAHSPARNQAALASLPQKLWLSSADTVALPGLAQAYATAVGAPVVDIGTNGHSISTPPPYGCLPYSDVASWLASRA